MGRIKLNYSLYKRRMSSGLVVYYYRTYTPDGKRTSGISTGCTSISKARLYCENLYKEGKLYAGNNTLFSVFAKDFFSKKSKWYKRKALSRPITDNYLKSAYSSFKPAFEFFKNTKIKHINVELIEKFKVELSKTERSTNSNNIILKLLKIVLDEAIREGLLTSNPINYIQYFSVINDVKKDSFTLSEVKSLIRHKTNSLDFILFQVVAVCTGMRLSEISGLRPNDIKDGYINLTEQYNKGKYSCLKTKEARKIPICNELTRLFELIDVSKNKDHRYFDLCKNKAIDYTRQKNFKALTIEEGRKVSFHSFRHFFNTYMLSKGVPEIKVASIMGHSTGVSSMQQRYTNFKVEDYEEIVRQQEILIKEIFPDGLSFLGI